MKHPVDGFKGLTSKGRELDLRGLLLRGARGEGKGREVTGGEGR